MELTINLYHLSLFLSLFNLATLLSVASSPIDWSSLRTLDIVKQFGARNDGNTDTKQALLNAWSVACSSDEPSQIYVPSGQYSLSSLTFEGSCKSPGIMLKIDGTLVANDLDDKSWIVFHQVDTLYIKGGVLDAKGKSVWDCKRGSHQGSCPHGASSLSFDNSKNVVVDDLKSTDSQMFHMSINACENMDMTGLSITADGDSPNTDGIHVEKSTGITITDSRISTGDDCISMGPNNKNIWIENVLCGPGHGISIGSLGRDDGDEGLVVQNVTVKSVTFTGTDNGLRIKTFATSVKGTVKDIYFSQATMVDARNPIIIDQNYCPQDDCPTGKGSGIQISNVVYEQIHGTSSSKEVVTLDCSPEKPCYGLTMNDIKLTYKSDTPECEIKNASGKVIGPMEPSKCLNW